MIAHTLETKYAGDWAKAITEAAATELDEAEVVALIESAQDLSDLLSRSFGRFLRRLENGPMLGTRVVVLASGFESQARLVLQTVRSLQQANGQGQHLAALVESAEHVLRRASEIRTISQQRPAVDPERFRRAEESLRRNEGEDNEDVLARALATGKP